MQAALRTSSAVNFLSARRMHDPASIGGRLRIVQDPPGRQSLIDKPRWRAKYLRRGRRCRAVEAVCAHSSAQATDLAILPACT